MYQIPEGFSAFPEFAHHVQQSVMPLLTMCESSVIAIGTAFAISADGLLMTAAHVVQEAIKQAVARKRADGGLEYELQFYALYLTDQKHGEHDEYVGGALPVIKFWHSPELDIAYCQLGSPYGPSGWMPTLPVFRLGPGVPVVGEKILGCGYYKMAGSIGERTTDGRLKIHYSQNTAYTTGKIVEVHPISRDAAMLTFPCFRTDARFDGGMSGGPVLNQHGSVCGVICSSLPADETSPEHVSYASLIWPALGTSVETPGHPEQPSMKLVFDLVKEGRIQVDASFASVQVRMHPDGSRTVGVVGHTGLG